MNENIYILITVYNNSNYFKKCLISVLNQNVSNYIIVVVDDNSDNKVKEIYDKYSNEKFYYFKNYKNEGPLMSRIIGMNILKDKYKIKYNDIVFLLDGDDDLIGNNVFEKIINYYNNEDILLTFGNWNIVNNDNHIIRKKKMDDIYQKRFEYFNKNRDIIIKENKFREEPFIYIHPRTFRFILWDKINLNDFYDSNNNIYRTATDYAFMYPMIEMAGKRFKIITEKLINYNLHDENLIVKNEKMNIMCRNEILKKKKYKPLKIITKKTIAYFEFNNDHREIQPVFYFLARKLGYKVDFYIDSNNIFKSLNITDKDYLNIFDNNKINIDDKKFNNYDGIILGTAEPISILDKFMKINNKNKIIIIHNYFKYYAKYDVKKIVLADFLTSNFDNNIYSINPIIVKPNKLDSDYKKTNNIFLVQGNFNVKKRNYNSLIEALTNLKDDGYKPSDILIKIIGKINKNDKKYISFRKKIILNEIEEYFDIVEEELDDLEYFKIVEKSKYILPLIDNTFNNKFFDFSSSSSINIGLAYNCIFVMNKLIAEKYNIDFGFFYESNDLYSGIIECLKCVSKDKIIKDSDYYKTNYIKKSLMNFYDIIN